jgi:hypothetical protein
MVTGVSYVYGPHDVSFSGTNKICDLCLMNHFKILLNMQWEEMCVMRVWHEICCLLRYQDVPLFWRNLLSPSWATLKL